MTLYNGESGASPLTGKFCGFLLPPNFISATNRAFIHFHTDTWVNHKGFELEYKAISGKLVFILCFILPLLTIHGKKGEKFENQNWYACLKKKRVYTFFSKSVVSNHGRFCQFGGVGKQACYQMKQVFTHTVL